MLYLLLPLLVIVAVLVVLALQPGLISVRRSTVIARDRQAVFNAIRDLRQWRHWSPWLLHEPGARLDYSDAPEAVGGWYAWDGQLIGAGRITHLQLEVPERIEQRIVFKRPFKSESAVTWELAERPEDGGTEVYWSMRGRMPFFFRFLAPMMSQMIGKDFELGLVLLRAHLDPAADQLAIRFIGPGEAPRETALTIPFDGGIPQMVQAMGEGFPRLAAAAAERGITPAGPPFTAYHMADPKKGHFRCDLALPVPDGTAPGELTVKQLGGGRAFVTEVQGSYDYLELAWYSLMAHLRMAKLRWDRARPSLEVYVNDPTQVPSRNDILTRIYVPIR